MVGIMTEYLCIPGHIPLKEAARRLHRSEKRVLQYILARRLPAHKVQGRYMIPITAIETFRQHPHGRIRTAPVLWHHYRAGAQVRILFVEVPTLTGQHLELIAKLAAFHSQQQHLFPGTMQRFIWLDEPDKAQVRIVLIWKTTDLRDEPMLQRHLENFQRDFADLLDWKRARLFIADCLAYT